MTLSMFRRDRAIRAFPKWFILVVAVVSFFSAIRAILIRAADSGALGGNIGHTAIVVAVLWIPVAIYILYAGTMPRSTRLDLSLPIDARDLWLVHFAAVTLSATCMFAASAAIIAFQDRSLQQWLSEGGRRAGPSVFAVGPWVAAGVLLGTAVVTSFDAAAHKTRFTGRYAALASAALGGLFVLIVALSHVPGIFALAPSAAALWWIRRTYARVPLAFAAVPREADAPGAEVPEEAHGRPLPTTDPAAAPVGAVGPLGRHRAVSRIVWEWWWILYYALLLTLGALLAGVPYRWMGEADTRFANISIIWYMLFVLFPPAMKRMFRVDPLPISRRTIFAHLAIPGVMCLVVAYGASEVTFGLWGPRNEDLSYRERDSHYYLSAPVEACKLSWGDPPVNTAPWGESHEAWSTVLVRGFPLRVYSPFSTPPGSSIEFVSWQMERAVRALYGVTLPASELEGRYLRVNDEGRIVPKDGSLSIRRDYPDLRPSGGGRVFPVALLLAAFPALLLTGAYFRMFRGAHGPFARTVVAVAILGGTLALHISAFSLALVASSSLWAWTGALKIATRVAADLLPGGVPTLWVLCALVISGGYAFAERQFERIEIPAAARKPVD